MPNWSFVWVRPGELRDLEQRLMVVLDQLSTLTTKVNHIMSQITDFAAAVDANFTKIQDGIASLDNQIQDLQASAGTLAPADQAALDKIAAESAALATAASAPVTPPVPAAKP